MPLVDDIYSGVSLAVRALFDTAGRRIPAAIYLVRSIISYTLFYRFSFLMRTMLSISSRRLSYCACLSKTRSCSALRLSSISTYIFASYFFWYSSSFFWRSFFSFLRRFTRSRQPSCFSLSSGWTLLTGSTILRGILTLGLFGGDCYPVFKAVS